jgi:hypothetical protein
MAELNSAKELAQSFANNKDIYALAIRQVKDLLVTERELQTEKDEYNTEAQILYQKLERKNGTYKSFKQTTVFIGIIASIFVVLVTYILPFYQQEVGQDASKSMTKWILVIGAVTALIYLIISHKETKMKERIDAFKVNLENKKTVAKLLFEILYFHKKHFNKTNIKEFSETGFKEYVREWLSVRYLVNPVKNIAQLVLPFDDRYSMKSIAREMGEDDFTQLILLKGQEKELLEEIEIDIEKDEVKYRITNEMEKLKNNRK